MNLPLKVARRYFFSKHKKGFINIISIISLAVVAVGTMALIIALSVFNGLEDVVRGLHSKFNPDLKVMPLKGKTFAVSADFLKKIRQIAHIQVVSEVIEDNALLKYRDAQMVVTLKGVSENYLEQTKLDSAILSGRFKLQENKQNFAVIGQWVQQIMSISLRNDIDKMYLWYPKRQKKVNLSTANPEKSFNQKPIMPAGVFMLEKQYDDKYVFVPLSFAQDLLEYENRRTALEIKVDKPQQINAIQQQLKNTLGENFVVQNRDEQDASLLKAIKIEKLFVYLTLSFILAVASFNIFFALMMLVIDKQKDIAILQAMGAKIETIRQIFFLEGVIIAFTGAAIGLFLGTSLCLLQQQFGFISMGTSTTVVTAYPVKLAAWDFVYTTISIILITLISSYIPAIRATKVELKENL
ncbi:MAG: ABC transporter permease [Microscillaceae bacterium]|nr:ABC transporter permease [Microscillaceae bacterium]